jgi:peptide/nickel transport system substrate-binding protein
LGQKNLNLNSFYLPQYTAIFFNQKQNEILKDKNIRKALALGIDKQKILTQALQLEGEIIDGPILPLELELPADKKINFDPELANKILDDAGWQKISTADYHAFLIAQQEKEKAETDQKAETPTPTTTPQTATPTTTEIKPENKKNQPPEQEYYRKKDDAILTITITTVTEPENTKAAELIQQAWQNLGVKVDLQIISEGRINREIIKPRNYQILLYGIIVGSNSDPYPFWHSSQIQDPGLNLALLSSRDVDKLLEDAKTAKDENKKKEAYQRFQDILNQEVPAIFLYNPTYTYPTDKKIKGIDTSEIIFPSDRLNNLNNWYVKVKRTWQGK